MGYIVRMPQMGMSMDEGVVVEWMIEEGESVEEGEVVVVVESEKASNEVEARESGVLRRIVTDEGAVVEPGEPIGILAGPDEDIAEFEEEIGDLSGQPDSVESAASGEDTETEARASSAPSALGADERSTGTQNVRATPGARKLAAEEDVDLSGVEGSGPDGVVVESDVEERLTTLSTGGPSASDDSDVRAAPGARQLAAEQGIDLTAIEGTGPQGVVTEEDVRERGSSSSSTPGEAAQTVTETRSLSSIQESISDRLSQSARDSVHVTLNRSFDTTSLRETRARAEVKGIDVSLTDLILKSVGRTLETYPEFNATFKDGEHRLVAEKNIGVAVDIEDGLVTPVVPDVAEKTAEEVGAVRRELTERVLSGDFDMDDLTGATFTVSNLGVFGVDHFDPIINPPQIAILGIGRIRDDGSMTLSLSFDHRVVNGADAARFLDSLNETLTDESELGQFFAIELGQEPALRDREVRVETKEGFSGRYRTAYGEVRFDEPEDAGGDGSAPSPVDHLLGALGSCLSLSVREMARRDDVGVGGIECSVTGTPETGPVESVRVELKLESEADDPAIEKVVMKAERACYVARSLSDELDVSLEWKRG